MLPISVLRPITDARIEVIPPSDRADAVAAMARAIGRPHLRSVAEAKGTLLFGDPQTDDVVIGMYARNQCSDKSRLVGIVRTRERFAPRIATHESNDTRERAFLIDALTTSEDMDHWNPPVRTLLAATAATVIATISHDPSFITYVACRLPERPAPRAFDTFEGQPLELPPSVDAARLSFGDVPSSELFFLDNIGAAKAAAIVRDHMSGGVIPSNQFQLPTSGKTCEALLTIQFPPALQALKTEIDLLASSGLDVGWRRPRVASNDAAFPMRAASGL
jgi:hypothetical protein